MELRPEGRYAAFAGNFQRLADGTTLAGWSLSEADDGTVPPLASRVSATGQEVWSLRAEGWFSYRRSRSRRPTGFRPGSPDVPRPFARYPEGTDVTPRFTCQDRGASNLTDCRVAEVEGGPLSAGPHRITLVADDGAGNSVTRRVQYVVALLRQPDLQVRADPPDGPRQTSSNAADRFTATGQSEVYPVRIVNAGYEGEQFRITGRRGQRGWSVRYLRGRRDITRQLVDGLLSPRLVPGQSWAFRIVVRRTARAADGQERLTWVRAYSTMNPTRRDRIAVVSRAR